ncbi:hypothetical protein [uncultured Aquimarina sp.]|uniref:hypothetical protein n=1 Tax=uncultured Aquimarina sp. TaxID=575652 RepID=UPI0026350ADD|nr:hypothetical protein [uncultured Aquimarina sp.]
MKPIKLVIVLLLSNYWMLAQTHSESIADAFVAGQKATINAMLGYELSQRNLQTALLKGLEETEESYNSKRTFSASNIGANSLIIYAAQKEIQFLEQKIRDIRANIRILKVTSFLFGSGLSRYENELKKEENYLMKIKNENGIIASGVFISGGTGHVYTSYLKLLIRISPIKNNILKINKEIKARMTVTRIFAR